MQNGGGGTSTTSQTSCARRKRTERPAGSVTTAEKDGCKPKRRVDAVAVRACTKWVGAVGKERSESARAAHRPPTSQ